MNYSEGCSPRRYQVILQYVQSVRRFPHLDISSTVEIFNMLSQNVSAYHSLKVADAFTGSNQLLSALSVIFNFRGFLEKQIKAIWSPLHVMNESAFEANE